MGRVTRCTLILIGIVASAHAKTLSEMPNPVGSAMLCGWPNTNTAHVCDPDGVISDGPFNIQQLNAIDAVLADIEGGTKCAPGSAQFAVAAVAKMDGGSGSKANRARAWAKGLHDKWGVGHKECQNGIVLFLSLRDRVIHISTGAGIKSTITEHHIKAVVDDVMKEHMRAGRVGTAVLTAVREIRATLRRPDGDTSTLLGRRAEVYKAQAESGKGIMFVFFLFFALVFLFIICAALSQTRQQRRLRTWQECRERLRAVDRLARQPQDAADESGGGGGGGGGGQPTATREAIDMDVCPICLDELKTMQADKKLTLSCGHSFCAACIDRWMTGGHNTCPICRHREFGPGEDGAQQTQQQQRRPNNNRHHRPRSWSRSHTRRRRHSLSMRDAEADFMLWSARRRYPTFVSRAMVDGRRSRTTALAEDSRFVAAKPKVTSSGGGRSSGSSSRRWSSTSSGGGWGGGSSSGGGGGGGSW